MISILLEKHSYFQNNDLLDSQNIRYFKYAFSYLYTLR